MPHLSLNAPQVGLVVEGIGTSGRPHRMHANGIAFGVDAALYCIIVNHAVDGLEIKALVPRPVFSSALLGFLSG
jgi:hypothetical protein